MTRHGETIENIARIVQGHLPGKLSEKGIEQARKVAYRLKDEHLDYIFSSDSTRAFDTAQEIARFHQDVPLEATEELRERYFGDLQGKVGPSDWEAKRWNTDYAIEHNLETPQELFERSRNFLEELLNGYQAKMILSVAHNGINQALTTYILRRSWQEIGQIEKFGNTSITIFEFNKNNTPVLQLMNCTKHLEN